MLTLPEFKIPIQIIEYHRTKIAIKREDLIHPTISGNKYWKLFYSVNNYLSPNPKNPFLITFGGAFSNHIAALAAFGKINNIPTLGIIRGEEWSKKWADNPTLKKASENGMARRFVSRSNYRDKIALEEKLKIEFPSALIIPEGGTSELAVKGLQNMLNTETKDFFYICAAVGTGGTLAGISKFCEPDQQPLGFVVVKDKSIEERVKSLSKKENFKLIDASEGGYGKISDSLIAFINDFKDQYRIPLDPIYTGKMMKKIFELIDRNYFDPEKKILAFHTGGLQGIEGANQMLIKKNRTTINY